MKRQRLSGNDTSPDFSVATGITFFIIIFSLLISSLSAVLHSHSPDILVMSMWGIFASSIMTLLLLWFILTRYRTYVIQLLKHPFEYFLNGLYYYLLFLPILFVVTAFSFYIFKAINFTPEPQEIILLYLRTDSFYLMFIIFFLSCIVAPFSEELIFRGMIYAGLKQRFSIPLSMILSSLIFALLHNEIFVMAGLFAFGIFLSYLFEKHKNLWLSISVHFFNNFFTTVIILMFKYLKISGT